MADDTNLPENGQDAAQPSVPEIPGLRRIGVKKKRTGILNRTSVGKKINRKWMLVGGVTILVVVAGATLMAPRHHKKAVAHAQVQPIQIVPNAVSNASFDKSTEQKLSQLQIENMNLREDQHKLASLVRNGQASQKKMETLIAQQQQQIQAQKQLLEQQEKAVKAAAELPPPPPPPSVSPNAPAPILPPSVSMPPPSQISSNTHETDNGLGTEFTPKNASIGGGASGVNGASGARISYTIQKNPYAGYIPAGSFMPAVLLTGIEANTANSSSGNPQPVLMRIQRKAILPNFGAYNLANCFVIGSATGSISSRRAGIRLTSLSCTNQKHQMVLEAPLKGYAVDSDGKFGLRGRLVEREGSILEKSLLAGFASGLGGALGQGEGSTYSGSTGAGRVLSGLGQSFGAGAANGLNDAMNNLAQFYLNQAKNIFPVIEVPPGRKITLILVKGSSFVWHNANSRYILVKHPVKVERPAQAHPATNKEK